VSVMDDPVRLARAVGKGTAVLGGLVVGASVLGGVWQVGVGVLLGVRGAGLGGRLLSRWRRAFSSRSATRCSRAC
jgi:hypothetical protein